MTGKPMPCPNCGAIRHEHDAHFCAAARGASSAAAPSPEYIVRHPKGHLMVESARPYMPTEAEEAAALTSLAKASPVLAQHATHIDGEFDLALNAVRRMFAAWRDRSKGAAAPPANAPETSTSLVHAAPDAELDRLLCSMLSASYDHARGYDHGDPLSCAQCQQWVEDVHAHVERVKREAFTAGHKAGARVMAAVHEAPAPTGEVIGTAELYDSYVGHLQETHPYPRDALIPVDLVRREKEEG